MSQLLVDRQEVVVCLLHRLFALGKRHRGTTFGVGHQQCPCLIDPIAPLSDIIALQTAAGLVLTVLFHQLTLAAHRLLTVLPGVIEIRQIDTHTDGCTSDTDGSGLGKAKQLFLLNRLYQPRNHKEEDDEQIIIGHLHMVGIDFKGCENRRQQQSPQIAPLIGQHQTCNHRRQIGQCPYLPDMAGCDDNQEIGGEGPDDGT